MVEFVARTIPINGGNRTAAYLGFGITRAAELQALGQHSMAEALIPQSLSALGRARRDSGRWQLAWLRPLMPEPPRAQMASGTSGSVASLRPFGPVADATWSTAAMARTKVAASLAAFRMKKFNDGRGGGGWTE